MAHCPIETSKEWKSLLEKNEGNSDLTYDEWYKYGYGDIEQFPDLNKEIDNEEAEEAKKVVLEEGAAPKDPLERLMQNTVLHLRNRIAVLKRMKQPKEGTIDRLKELVENMEAAEGVESIVMFVKEAYDTSLQLKSVMKTALKDLEDPESNKKTILIKIQALNDFAYGYNILDEISTSDVIDYFNVTDKEASQIFEADEEGNPRLSTLQKLKEAVSIRTTIKDKIIDVAIPLLADFLLDARSSYAEGNIQENLEKLREQQRSLIAQNNIKKNKRLEKDLENIEERIRGLLSKTMDKEEMIETLREAAVEEGAFDYWIGPLISSPDSAIALFAKAIKDKIEEARMKDIVAKREIASSFEKYLSSSGVNRDNTKKFNEGLYEIVEVPVKKNGKNLKDSEGNIVYREQVRFVQKEDIEKINQAYRTWFNIKKNEKPYADIPYGKLTLEQKSERSTWQTRIQKEVTDKIYKEKSKEAIAKIDAQKKAALTDTEYTYWKKRRRYKEIREVRSEFISDKWKAMYNLDGTAKNIKGEYHRDLVNLYLSAQKKIPPNQRPGYVIPSVAKKDMERLIDEGVINLAKTKLKEAGNIQSYEIEFELQGVKGGSAKFLPVYYVQDIDIKDVSFDLASSVLLFNQMANKYEAMDSVHAEISLMQTVMDARSKNTPKFTKGLSKVRDIFAKNFGYENYIKQNGDSYSKKHLDAFVDMIIYGEMQKAEDLGFANLSATKVTNTITSISALTSIAADVLKGIANNLQGNIQLAIEAGSGQYFSYKHFFKGKKDYAKNIASMIGDFAKPTPTSFMGMLGELYDPLQGNFDDQYGKVVTASVANKLIRTNTLFFNQHLTEHEIQYSGMLSLMNSQEVRDRKTKEKISLYEAHEKYGATGQALFDNVDFIEKDKDGNETFREFTEKDRRSFQDRMHSLSKKLHGIYNSFDKGVAQRNALGRLALMYKKHMYPGYKRRFQKYAFDEELGDTVEGYYRTFWNTFMRDLRVYKTNIAKQWSTYSTTQKANIKRFLNELSMIFSIMGLIAILSRFGDDDDEMKDGYAYNFLMYELIRMRSETRQYLNPIDVYRTIKSPSAALSTVSRFIKFGNQILPMNITETYKKKQGVWEKGDNKAWAYFLKLMGYSGYNFKPGEAVKIYESLTNI